MAAQFIVIALAFCSASASVCMPVITPKDGCQVSFPEAFSPPAVAVARPRLVSGPRVISGPVVAPSFGISPEFVEPASEIASGSFVSGPARTPSVVQAPSVTLSPVESPIIALPSPAIPGPQVIRHKCYCTKTVVRPQLIQRTINVPRIHRYLKRTYRPVFENIAYTAKAVGGESNGQDIAVGGGVSSVAGPVSFVPGGVVSGGVVSGGIIPGGVVSGNIIPGGAISGGIVPGAPILEASETTCEQVVPTFPRCY